MREEYKFFTTKKAVVVDLGAGIGENLIYFAKMVGSIGIVIAIEPVIENYRKILSVIIDNKLTCVIPLMFAISNKTGSDQIYIHPYWDRHSLVFKENPDTGNLGKKAIGRRSVCIITWDDLVDSLGLTHVDLAKVDIEGAEILLLEGMTKVLPDKMIMEEHGWLGTDVNHLKELLKNKGYEIIKHEGRYIYAKKKGW